MTTPKSSSALPVSWGNHGVGHSTEKMSRKRDVVRCPVCNYEVYREMRTRGMYAGEWKLVDIEGRIHKCSVRKVKSGSSK